MAVPPPPGTQPPLRPIPSPWNYGGAQPFPVPPPSEAERLIGEGRKVAAWGDLCYLFLDAWALFSIAVYMAQPHPMGVLAILLLAIAVAASPVAIASLHRLVPSWVGGIGAVVVIVGASPVSHGPWPVAPVGTFFSVFGMAIILLRFSMASPGRLA